MEKAVAVYIRISMEDGDMQEGKTESGSITNQRALLQKYISGKEEFRGAAVQEFLDDGYTGRNFERPGFQRMLEQCRMGHIGWMVVKDLSRLGRNYVEVGNLLEQVFPFLGIRMVGDGMPRKEVVRVLNEENVLTAAIYKQRKGCTRDWFPDGKKGGWNTSMVAKIIRDERYAGHMVGHRKVYESFDSKRQVAVDRSEWIVVRNTHEGIVTQEEFDRANANMRSVVQGKKKNPANKGNFSVIVCPHCGLALRPGKNADSFMYCPTGRMHRDSPCGSVRIRRDVAEQVLMELVRKQAELLVSAEQVLKEKRRQRAGKQGMDIGDVKAEMKRLDDCKVSDYESYKVGKALGIKEYLHLEKYDKAVMASLIASAKVMGEDRLEVTWKYHDVYEKILGEMQG